MHDMDELKSLAELLWMLLTEPRTGILLLLLATAAWTDVRSYRIPNWLTGFGLLAGLLLSVWNVRHPGQELMLAFGGIALGLFALLPLYLIRILGAGDVKLMAMVGAFLGLPGTLHALVLVLITGGLVAIAYALSRRVGRQLVANLRQITTSVALAAMTGVHANGLAGFQSAGRIPYGVSICLGTAAYLVGRQLGMA
jgi:prepilin peptidase CpaA